MFASWSMSPDVTPPLTKGWPWHRDHPRIFWRCYLGNRIRARREELPAAVPALRSAHMSRGELARHLGVPEQTIWEIEHGIVPVPGEMLVQFADALHVHPGWFFDQGDLKEWSHNVEMRRLVHRLAALLSHLTPADYDVVETVFRYLNGRKARSA